MRKLYLQDYLQEGECCHMGRTLVRAAANNAHTHDFSEVFWIESGRGVHLINGERRALERGDLLFVRTMDEHDFESAEDEPLHLVGVAFFNEVLFNLAKRYSVFEKVLWRRGAFPVAKALTARGLRRLMGYYRDLSLQRSDVFALDFFLMRVAALSQESSTEGVNIPLWLEGACKEIVKLENVREGAPAFVRLAGRSHEHVARMTREFLGRTPSDIVKEARLNYVAEQLLLTDRTLLDVALECGFESMAYFHRCFKVQFGETPHQYRVRHRALVSAQGVL